MSNSVRAPGPAAAIPGFGKSSPASWRRAKTPEDVVRREAQEEAGIAVGPLTPVAAIFLTPGICSERCHIFAAPCDLAGAGGLHGHPDEGEDIRARAFSFDEAERLVREGGISNAITQVALQWLALNRQDLTQPAGKRT